MVNKNKINKIQIKLVFYLLFIFRFYKLTKLNLLHNMQDPLSNAASVKNLESFMLSTF